MENQQLTAITRGLQHAAAETNAMVAEQYLRVLSQYFDKDEDGTLRARMVRVQLSDDHHTFVPLVALATPSGLALDRMKVELSLRLESANTDDHAMLHKIRNLVSARKNNAAGAETNNGNEGGSEPADDARANFNVSISPRNSKTKGRPSDHVNIELEFRAIETPEAVMRIIDTYTNMIQPARNPDEDASLPPPP